MTEHHGTFRILERLPSSHDGNPRFLCAIEDKLSGAEHVCRTAPDSPLGFEVQNMNGEPVRAWIGMHYGKATLMEVRRV